MATNCEIKRSLEERVVAQEFKTREIDMELAQLSKAVVNNTEALDEFIQIAQGLKYGMKLLGVIEACAVFIIKFGGAAALLWSIWKFLILEALTSSSK